MHIWRFLCFGLETSASCPRHCNATVTGTTQQAIVILAFVNICNSGNNMENTATIWKSHSYQASEASPWLKPLETGLVEPWNRCRSTRGHCKAWPTTVGSACCRKWQSLRSWCCLQITTQQGPVMTSLMWDVSHPFGRVFVALDSGTCMHVKKYWGKLSWMQWSYLAAPCHDCPVFHQILEVRVCSIWMPLCKSSHTFCRDFMHKIGQIYCTAYLSRTVNLWLSLCISVPSFLSTNRKQRRIINVNSSKFGDVRRTKKLESS